MSGAALGHQSLTYLGGPANAWSDGERSRALSKFAERAGIKVFTPGLFAPTVEGGRRLLTSAQLAVRPRLSRSTTCSPSACCNDCST